jgi:predicted nuclease of predicted toxin-antitoxin system
MDENVHGAITRGLRKRGIDVRTAQGDLPPGTSDPHVLDRATTLGRVLFSQDDDLLREAARRQQTGEPFAGVIFAAQEDVSIGRCVDGRPGTDRPSVLA